MAILTAVLAGRPRTYEVDGVGAPLAEPWTTAIFKQPVAGPVWLGTLGLAGDGVADTRHHGGPWQAVLMYCAEHYGRWRKDWGREDLGPGAFGENLLVAGPDESEACIGDRYRIGEVEIAVTSPRTPCNTLALRLGEPDVVKLVLQNHRSGWYARVVQEGAIEAGLPLTLLERPHPEWTIRRAAEARLHRLRDRHEAALLARCPALHPEWQEMLLQGEA